ncbi:MAG: HD domain-containing protein [Sedimenticola sp.]|nr:HD domain-containing protein [Sedimenticola sp.]
MHEPRDYPFLTAGSRALAIALDERDNYTHLHSSRVVELAHRLGLACGLERTLLSTLDMGAFFHDVGKIGIPDRILLKPDCFTGAEMAVMRQHPEKGEGIVRGLGLPSGDAVASAVRHHHEHFDGAGYPDGLRGEGIPVVSRIISVADSYDAMTGDRPYHPGRSPSEVLRIMHDEAGSKLDPYLVSKLERLI